MRDERIEVVQPEYNRLGEVTFMTHLKRSTPDPRGVLNERERILVVDDEELFLDIISSMLRSVGYECSVASSGIEALATLNSGVEFALLISNLMMPDGDGMFLLERTRVSFPDMPFVMETAAPNSSVIAAAYQEGAYDYVLKPFTPAWLVAAVRRALDYRRLNLENRAYRAEIGKQATAGLPAPGESPTRVRILVVDDEEAVCEMISSMLGSEGYQCRTATTGIEALAILDSGEQFELLTSGLVMPDGDGMFLLERTRDRFPDMPFVMVTSTYDASAIAAAYQEGAYDYILKPFDLLWLVTSVRRALQYRRLKIENQTFQAEFRRRLSKPSALT
jgi:DNA-binding NtrC family response regulator